MEPVIFFAAALLVGLSLTGFVARQAAFALRAGSLVLVLWLLARKLGVHSVQDAVALFEGFRVRLMEHLGGLGRDRAAGAALNMLRGLAGR